MFDQSAERLSGEAADVQRQWYAPPKPAIPHGWPVYTLDFVLATLQGFVTEPQRTVRTTPWVVAAHIIRAAMSAAQALLMLLAWIPLLSSCYEMLARTFTRNALGFFLRACYWRAKLRHLGQDTIIDQGVEIWGPAAVTIGYRCHIDTNVRLAAGERRHRQHGSISIGNFVHLGPGVHIAGRGGVEIRDFVGIMANSHLYSATGVVERPGDPGQLMSMSHMAPHDQQHIVEGPILIEDYAVLGMMSRVLPNVRVGTGAVIHANCEVVRDVLPFANMRGAGGGRQIGWRKPRRQSPRLAESALRALPDPNQVAIEEARAPMSDQDMEAVLDLHFDAFPDGVTSQLGRTFVRKYYEAMISSTGATLWLARRAGRVCGFMGCSIIRHSFEKVHRSGSAKVLAMWRFVTFRLSPVAVLRAIRKRRLSREFPDRAELLSIVVSKAERRLGIGRKFLDVWVRKLQDQHIRSYIVFTDNPEGIQFYEKNRGECLFKFEMRALWSACYRFGVHSADAVDASGDGRIAAHAPPVSSGSHAPS